MAAVRRIHVCTRRWIRRAALEQVWIRRPPAAACTARVVTWFQSNGPFIAAQLKYMGYCVFVRFLWWMTNENDVLHYIILLYIVIIAHVQRTMCVPVVILLRRVFVWYIMSLPATWIIGRREQCLDITCGAKKTSGNINNHRVNQWLLLGGHGGHVPPRNFSRDFCKHFPLVH